MFSFLAPKIAYRDKIGQSTWLLLHAIADHFPLDEEEGRQYEKDVVAFLTLLARLYPCENCRAHMKTYFDKCPPRFDNRAHAVRWVFNFHNEVNRQLKKPIFTPKQYADRLQQYEGVRPDGVCANCSVL